MLSPSSFSLGRLRLYEALEVSAGALKLRRTWTVLSTLAITDQQRFEAIVDEHQTTVFRTLARLVGRSDRLEDLAQEVFLRLWRALPQFRGDAQVNTYLYRIVFNVAQDEWKRRKRSEANVSFDDPDAGWADRLSGSEPSAADVLTAAAVKAEVEAALLNLPEIERTALVLFHQEERSYLEVSAILGQPLNTVRTYLHRGRERLRRAVQERMKEAKR